jgi:hypothetical protein
MKAKSLMSAAAFGILLLALSGFIQQSAEQLYQSGIYKEGICLGSALLFG